MGERRFDVRIPDANKTVLDLLAQESRETGVPESRLIVVWLTHYAKMTKGGAIPLMVPGLAATAPIASHGHRESNGSKPAEMPFVLNDAVGNSFLEDD